MRGDFRKALLLIFLVLSIALGATFLSILTDAPRISVVPFAQEDEISAILANVLFIVGVASLSIPFFYFTLKKGWVLLLEKMFAIGGGFMTLFLSGMFSMHVFERSDSVFLFVPVWICVVLIGLSVVFTITNVFSEETRNIMFLVFASVIGSLMGMGIPVFSMVFVLMFLIIIDVMSFRLGAMKKVVNLLERRRILVCLRYSDMELMVGIGDLVFYSMLASYALINFGALTTFFSVILILVGSVITFVCSAKNEIFPGLPVTIGLGLTPIIVRLASLMV